MNSEHDSDDGNPNPVTWVIFSGLATLGLAFFPLNELAYLCFGTEAMAPVIKAEQNIRRGRVRSIDLTYQYKESGGALETGTTNVLPSDYSSGARLLIEYRTIPYSSSRPVGVEWFGLSLFAIAAGVTGFLGVTIVRQAREFREQERERAERRKRKKKRVVSDPDDN